MMTLYEFMKTYDSWEVTCWDKEIDVEFYFYNEDDAEAENDLWDSTMLRLSKLLEVVEVVDGEPGMREGVVVDMYGLIEKHLAQLKAAHIIGKRTDTADVVENMEMILAGNLTEKEFDEFVSALEE